MKLRKLAALIGAMALTFSAASSVLATGFSVDICHASDSETNPYISESPAVDSTGFLHGGHLDHTGPVWFPGAKDADVIWGDIIPPYDFDTGDGVFHFAGLNWTDAGQAIWNNGCNPFPAINIVKTASVDNLPAGGGDVTYTYVVTNTGQVALSNVTVTDDKCAPATLQSGDANSNSKLDLTETWTFTCTATITETTTNVGTATGHDGDHTVTDTDTKTVTVLPPVDAPSDSIVKTADPTSLPADGGDVTYTYVVANTGNVSIFNIVVTDDNGTPGTPGDDFTVTCPHDSLAAGESMTCTADVTGITADTTNVGTLNADWDSCHDDCSTALTPVTDDATVTVAPAADAPSVNIDKTADPTSLPAGGGDITYTYVVTNTGNVGLTDIVVSDDNGTPDNMADDFIVECPHSALEVGEHMTCMANVSGTTVTTTNIATVTATAGETTVTDTDDATVTVLQGGVGGETHQPTPPPTDALTTTTTDAGGTLPLMLIVLGIIGLGAVMLTPTRKRR